MFTILFRMFIVLILCTLQYYAVTAQKLKVGQKLPVSCLAVTLNDSSNKICFPYKQKKLLILEFWSHSCISCIQNFPTLDSLQKELGNQIQIILVNKETKDSTARFFAKRRYITIPKLAFLNGDKILYHYFFWGGYPFSVWLDPNGTVLSISKGRDVSKANVLAVLKNKKADLHPYGIEKPTSAFSPEVASTMKYYSFLGSCSDLYNVGNVSGLKYDNQCMRLSMNCVSMTELFKKAFEEKVKFRFATSGSIRNLVPGAEKDIYKYDLMMPAKNPIELYKVMQNELMRYFNVCATVDSQTVKCLSLVRTGKQIKFMTNGGTPVNTLLISSYQYPVADSLRVLVNYPMAALTEQLRVVIEDALGITFSNESGYEGNVDFEIKGRILDNYDLSGIRKALNEIGLDLVEREKRINVLTIKRKIEEGRDGLPQ